jgi:hypothetical protein
MDFISEGYFQNSGAKPGTTTAHIAIVLRNDLAKMDKGLPQDKRFVF